MRLRPIFLIAAFSSIMLLGCGDNAVPCSFSTDCVDSVCGPSNKCQKGYEGEPCIGDGHCAYEPDLGVIAICDLGTARCVETECRYGDDCESGACLADGSCDPRTCQGTALPCSLLTPSECGTANGCTYGGSCTGVAYSCISFDGYPLSCGAQDGCWYYNAYGWCQGTAFPCSSYSNQFSCQNQYACSWSNTCSGVAGSCSSYDNATCDSIPGCALY